MCRDAGWEQLGVFLGQEGSRRRWEALRGPLCLIRSGERVYGSLEKEFSISED